MVTYSKKYIPGDRLMTCAVCGFDYRYSQMRKIKWPIIKEKGTSAILRDSGNQLTNGDFENSTTGWTAGNSATLEAVTTSPQSGTYCLKITENNKANPFAYQSMNVSGSDKYFFSFYVKSGDEATFQVRAYDNTNSATINWVYTEANTSWKKHIFSFTVPTGCTSVLAVLYQICSQAAGTYLYYDNVKIYKPHEEFATTLRDTPEGMYVCPKCYDGDHPRNTPPKLRKKQPLRYPS